jgi:type I restriction enzyme S subunit
MRSYPKYKPSRIDWLGEIPSSWDYTDLKRVIRFAYGDSLSDENRNGGDVPVYGSNGIIGFHDKAITKAPCIIVGRKGSYGKINFSKKACFPIDTSYFVDSTQTKCNLRWLMYFLSILRLDENTLDDTVPGLSREWVYKMPILVPPLSEQQQIADFLDYKMEQCDRFIANRQKQIELLNEQKASIINKAVTKGINPNVKMKPSGIDWIGDIPEHWEFIRLASFGRFSKGSGISKSDLVETGLPVILYGDIYTKYNLVAENIINFISQDLATNSKLIYKGDLLFTGSGETREDIGKCIVYNGNSKAYAGGDIMIFRQKIHESLFLAYSLSSNYAIAKKAMNSRGDIIVHIYSSALRDIYLPIPSLSEQQKILEFIKKETSTIETLISKYQKQIDLMQEYRTALISQAVTGKIDVREWKTKTKEKTS